MKLIIDFNRLNKINKLKAEEAIFLGIMEYYFKKRTEANRKQINWKTFINISKSKIINDLKVLWWNKMKIYRITKSLEKKGLLKKIVEKETNYVFYRCILFENNEEENYNKEIKEENKNIKNKYNEENKKKITKNKIKKMIVEEAKRMEALADLMAEDKEDYKEYKKMWLKIQTKFVDDILNNNFNEEQIKKLIKIMLEDYKKRTVRLSLYLKGNIDFKRYLKLLKQKINKKQNQILIKDENIENKNDENIVEMFNELENLLQEALN